MGALREYHYTFIIILREFFLEWQTFQTKVVEKFKTHVMFSNVFQKIVPFMR